MTDYSNQTLFFDPPRYPWEVNIIGMGGIGANVFSSLISLGVRKINIFDGDRVEARNVPTQPIYRHVSDLERLKVEAANDYAIRQESTCQITIHPYHVTAKTRLRGVVISCVDNMTARINDIWPAVKYNSFVPLFMDGRIGGLEWNLLTLNPSDPSAIEVYEEDWLYPSSEALQQPCGGRVVIGPLLVLAGHVADNLTLHYQGRHPEPLIRGELG